MSVFLVCAVSVGVVDILSDIIIILFLVCAVSVGVEVMLPDIIILLLV